MRRFVVTLALALQVGAAGAAPMDLPESVRTALASARAAQKEHRNLDAIESGRAGIARSIANPDVRTWHVAPLLRTMAEAYEQAGAMRLAARAMTIASLAIQEAPDKHDDLRRWFAAEAAQKLRRVGALDEARKQMDYAVRDIVSFVDRADKVARETAMDTLLDDVELSLASNDRRMAQATLALVRHLMVVHDISEPDLLAWYSQLLERTNDDGIPGMH